MNQSCIDHTEVRQLPIHTPRTLHRTGLGKWLAHDTLVNILIHPGGAVRRGSRACENEYRS